MIDNPKSLTEQFLNFAERVATVLNSHWSEIGKKQPKGDYATNEGLTSGLAKKAEKAHTHTSADVTDLSQTISTALEPYVTKTSADAAYLGKTAKAESAKVADSANAVTWANVSGKPSTVAGYGITFATTTEAEAGTDTTKPMNAAATKAAILALAPAPDLSGYLTKTDAASTYLGKTAKAASASTADTAAKLTTARTLSLTGDGTASLSFDGSANASGALTLAASGASAGSYGPTADATATFGGTIAVPQVTVDAKGRVTSIASRTITLPSGADLDDAATKTDILAAADKALSGMDVDPAGSPTLDAILSSLSALESDVPQKLGQDTVHIVATWQSEDGLSWYRKYSDGWIEQGGKTKNVTNAGITVTMPLAFSSTNYRVLATVESTVPTNEDALTINPTSETTFFVWGRTYNAGNLNKPMSWFACGY